MIKLISFQVLSLFVMFLMPIEPIEAKEMMPGLFSIYFGVLFSLLFLDFVVSYTVKAFSVKKEIDVNSDT